VSNRARILIFTGNGKGKTTSALGLALRAYGHGLKVHIIQFIKGADTGELSAVNAMANIHMAQTGLWPGIHVKTPRQWLCQS